MSRQLKTARRKLFLDDDADADRKYEDPTQEISSKIQPKVAECSTSTVKNVKEAPNTHNNMDKSKGYKLREPSKVTYFEESHNDTEDFSPDCSEYVPSPQRILHRSRSTSSLDVDSHDGENAIMNITLQENERHSTSSLGGDSNVIESLVDNQMILRTPSTVSNLSLMLDDCTDFVASPNVIYIQKNKPQKSSNTENFPILDISLKEPNNNQSSLLESINVTENENFPILDISLKEPNNNQSSLLESINVTDKSVTEDNDKTLTPNKCSCGTTITSLELNETLKEREEEENEHVISYKIEILIEPESPQTGTEFEHDESSLNNLKEMEESPLDLIDQSPNECPINQDTIQNNAVEPNNEMVFNNPENDDNNMTNQSPEKTSVGPERKPDSRPQTPLQAIPIERLSDNEVVSNDAGPEREADSRPQTPLQAIPIERLPDNEVVSNDAGPEREADSRPQTPFQAIPIERLPDNEVVSNDAGPQQESVSDSENEDQGKKLTRKRKCDPSEWKDNKNKRLKNAGKEYEGARNKKHNISKAILPCCNCKKNCGLKFSSDDRQALHTRFYALANREHQWQYIVRHVKAEDVKKITVQRKNNRTQTIKYHFPLNNEEVQVCKVFFLNTLSITEQMIYTALEKIKADETLIDKRGLHQNRPNRMKPSTEMNIKTHINSFPRVKAHYTRKDSQRKYLDECLNISKMYRLYKTWFADQNYSDDDVQIATKRQYERVFNTQFNLSFFKPKKDQCTLCSKYDQADPIEKATMEEKRNKHLKMKDTVRKIKDEEKETLNKDDTVVAIYDLQKVLSVPRSEVSIFHYKRKYPVYNFTVYDALNKRGFCYVWHAQIGKKGCMEIGSCLWQFIQTMHEKGIRKFIFYSDGCYGQNKNRYIFALYLYAATTLQIDITHRFFVGGHSQNEGDSMHACIEKALKYKVVYTPDQIYNIIMNAKVSGEKYVLKEMQQTEILNIKELVESKRWLQDKSGDKVRWSDVMEVSVSHTKRQSFFFKYDYDEEYSELNYELSMMTRNQQGRRGRNQQVTLKTIGSVELKPAYDDDLPISKALFDDLQSLCSSQSIPAHYHGFFNSLKHSALAEDDYNDDRFVYNN